MHNKQTVHFKDPMHFCLIVVNKSLRLAWIYVNICNFVKYFDPPTLQFRHLGSNAFGSFVITYKTHYKHCKKTH